MGKIIKIYIPVGGPASGKTTWGLNFLSHTAYIQRDILRYFYHNDKLEKYILYDLIKAAAYAELDIYVDNIYLTKRERIQFITDLEKVLAGLSWQVYYIYKPISIESALLRNQTRQHQLEDEALIQSYNTLEPPSKDEHPKIQEVWTIEE